MKKFIVFLGIFLMFSLNASAQTTATPATTQAVTTTQATTTTKTVTNNTTTTDKQLARVTAIGQKLLSANGLPTKITFFVSDEDEVNAYANIDSEIHVYKGLLNIVQTDDELAAVISHEIGHIANRHIQKQTILGMVGQSIAGMFKRPVISKVATGAEALTMLKLSRSAEYESDLTGVDLMIGAGYNPQGMLSLLNKIAQNFIDVIQTHPSGNKRLENVYDYLSFNYPSKLKTDYNTNSYRQFKLYITAVVNERNANPTKMAAYTKKQTKQRDKKLKRAISLKNESNIWGSAYNVIQATPQFQQSNQQ